jgi:hypothetical protein
MHIIKLSILCVYTTNLLLCLYRVVGASARITCVEFDFEAELILAQRLQVLYLDCASLLASWVMALRRRCHRVYVVFSSENV